MPFKLIEIDVIHDTSKHRGAYLTQKEASRAMKASPTFDSIPENEAEITDVMSGNGVVWVVVKVGQEDE